MVWCLVVWSEAEGWCWKAGVIASPHWNSSTGVIRCYWNLSQIKIQPPWETLGCPKKCFRVIRKQDWHDKSWVAACQYCVARFVIPSNGSRGRLWQQLFRKMIVSEEAARWEERRNTLRYWSKDSNCVTQPDGWANLLADRPIVYTRIRNLCRVLGTWFKANFFLDEIWRK